MKSKKRDRFEWIVIIFFIVSMIIMYITGKWGCIYLTLLAIPCCYYVKPIRDWLNEEEEDEE
jgi:hypothetical protein